MIKMQDIINCFELNFPKNTAEEWDNTGFLSGRYDKSIERIGICLDITSEIVDRAVKSRLDLLISHHPVIFSPLRSLVDDSAKTSNIRKLIINDINVYCAHTNLDNSFNGTGHCLARSMDLKNITRLNEEIKHVLIGELNREYSLIDICAKVKQVLDIEHIRVTSYNRNIQKTFKNMAVSPGSFDISILKYIKKDHTVILTGDLKYHDASDALEEGHTIIDAGHYPTENPICNILVEILKKEFLGIETIIKYDSMNPLLNF